MSIYLKEFIAEGITLNQSIPITIDKKPSLLRVDITLITIVLFVFFIVGFGSVMLYTLHSIVSYQENSAKYINVSGQQRMLSQRLALYSLRYMESADTADRLKAQQAVERINSNLRYLLGDEREEVMLSEKLRSMYFQNPLQIEESIKAYTNAVSQIISIPPAELKQSNLASQKQYILENVTPLLLKLDTVVHQYELEAQAKVRELKQVEYFVFASFIIFGGVILCMFVLPWIRSSKLKQAKLHKDASTDHLTNLLNRKALQEISGSIFSNSQHNDEPLSGVMVDIDYFKKVNDEYGHVIGDQVLIAITKLIGASLRKEDFCFRYGGEEIFILLPSTTLAQAQVVSEKIRTAIKDTPITTREIELNLTVSIGLSSKRERDISLDNLIERADLAMYRAKNSGRNRIVID